jgi:hypothetical protein
MPQELTINGRTFEHHWVTGKVTGASKHLETRISGGGGSGYSHNGTGFSSTTPVTSGRLVTVVQHCSTVDRAINGVRPRRLSLATWKF